MPPFLSILEEKRPTRNHPFPPRREAARERKGKGKREAHHTFSLGGLKNGVSGLNNTKTGEIPV